MNQKKNRHFLRQIILIEVLVVIVGILLIVFLGMGGLVSDRSSLTDEDTEPAIKYEEITEPDASLLTNAVPAPEIDVQLLTINEWSRPGKKIESLDYIVIHYLGNPETTAQQNHDYFESLKDLQNMSMSANYVIGMDGEIIQCIPDDEVAYASNEANSYSISIENCHPDETGKLTKKTYDALVQLTAYLTEKYGLERDQIIRHYDVTGKDCPKYYVENEDAWEAFKDDVMDYREECEQAALEIYESQKDHTTADDELSNFLESNASDE